jgi:hypothetical protein
MTNGETVRAAIEELRRAISTLDNALDMRFDRERSALTRRTSPSTSPWSRSRLAQELDQSEFRANRLEEVNREVSRRLVTAMETIRAVLDR